MAEQIYIEPLSSWIPDLKHPLVISGPCSAESELQMHATAGALAKLPQVRILRAGIWKPRTRPNSFEGVGEVGLQWLQSAARGNGLLSATEVANAQHVEACLKAGIDVLWIGARTTANPFSVQEIADVLKGLDIPVFVKNPINPDIQLWIGALERISMAGIKKIAAIHRGFTSFGKSHYRNPPQWDIAIELKRLLPAVEVICDPSHIAGSRHLIADVSQKALDLEVSGLMIEAHIDPAAALSDAKQQVTPDQLGEILSNLVIRQAGSDDPQVQNQLVELRRAIDLIDDEIIDKIAARMELVEKIGQYKRENNVTILQIERWRHVIARWLREGKSFGLDETFLLQLLQAIHQESIRKQTEAGETGT